MKKITLYLNDEMVEVLDEAVKFDTLYNYPKEQAYRIYIQGLILGMQKSPPYSLIPCCCCIPEHQHPPAWCMEVKE